MKWIAIGLLLLAGAGWHQANIERALRIRIEVRADSLALRNACLESAGVDCTQPMRVGARTPFGDTLYP